VLQVRRGLTPHGGSSQHTHASRHGGHPAHARTRGTGIARGTALGRLCSRTGRAAPGGTGRHWAGLCSRTGRAASTSSSSTARRAPIRTAAARHGSTPAGRATACDGPTACGGSCRAFVRGSCRAFVRGELPGFRACGDARGSPAQPYLTDINCGRMNGGCPPNGTGPSGRPHTQRGPSARNRGAVRTQRGPSARTMGPARCRCRPVAALVCLRRWGRAGTTRRRSTCSTARPTRRSSRSSARCGALIIAARSSTP
jgi:hypothetical protein